MRRRKYKLHAAFMNATMISAIDAPVEFEVSIGEYKMEEFYRNTCICYSMNQYWYHEFISFIYLVYMQSIVTIRDLFVHCPSVCLSVHHTIMSIHSKIQ